MTFLSSFIEVADRLAGKQTSRSQGCLKVLNLAARLTVFPAAESEVQMSAVDCGEWTHLCAAQSHGSLPMPFQPITTFPCVLLLRPQASAQHYRGMLDTEALHLFIVLWGVFRSVQEPTRLVRLFFSFFFPPLLVYKCSFLCLLKPGVSRLLLYCCPPLRKWPRSFRKGLTLS